MNMKRIIDALYEKSVLTKDTIIEAKYPALIMGGMQTALMTDNFAFQKYDNGILFLKRVNTDVVYKLLPENVILIDGMDLERLASIYGIKRDGSTKKVKIDPITGLPVRRGRKTNKVKEMINDRLNSLKQRDTTQAGNRKTKRSKSAA
jgi:hypothetical protein